MAEPIKLPPGATLVSSGDMKLPPGATLVSPNASTPPSDSNPIVDFAKGIGKGVVHTMSSADDLAAKYLPAFMTTPIGQTPTPENSARAVQAAKNIATPHNTAQSIGRGVEQAAEFLAPTGIEKGAAKLGSAALGKGGEIAGRLLGSGVHAGAINSVQGGSFAGGAAAGVAGSGIGMGLKAIAPTLAETALKMRATDRGYGATPGRAILDETTGLSPRKVVDTARGSLNDVQAEAGNVLDGSPKLVSLTPTRSIASDFLDRAVNENHEGTIKDLSKLGKQIDTEALSGAEIPEQVPASRAAALNRGISNAVTSWNPATANDTMNAAGKTMHHTLGNSIAEVVPEIKPLNQRMQSLMPVIQRGNAADLNANMLQRTIGRLGAHTGALAVGLGGYQAYGIPGAVGGLLGTEALASPETWIAAARAANSPLTRKIAIPAATGTLLQAARDEK